VVTTLAGVGGTDASGNPLHPGSADGTGPPRCLIVFVAWRWDSAGNLYVADINNNTIRKGFPASSVPAPVLEPPSLSAGQFGLESPGLPGLAVNIESSTNLSQWEWSGLVLFLTGGTNYYSVSPNPSLSAQFYRAQVR